MIDGIIPFEIADEPRAIRETLAQSAEGARAAADGLRARGVARIYVIGNGTSYHSSLAAATLYRRHALLGDPTVIALTAGAEASQFRRASLSAPVPWPWRRKDTRKPARD